MSSEQTEKATPKRRRKAAEQGDRLISKELLSAGALVAGVVALGAWGPAWVAAWRQTFRRSMELSVWAANKEPLEVATRAGLILRGGMLPLVWVGVLACAAAALLGLAQGGGRLTFAAVGMKWSRLNPAKNVQNLVGQQALIRLIKSFLPVAAIALIAVQELSALRTFPVLSLARLPFVFHSAYDLLLSGAGVMLLWSGIDFVSTWRARERRLRMSKQDVKDESKETEGSPQIKRRIRSIQRQMRGRKLRADVRKATVVITNPTHYAVALSFDFESMEAPRVLAKGRDLLAAEIREQARWAGVPLMENPPLAKSLYRLVQPGQRIPIELYAAVAGILAYLYRSEVEARLRRQAPAEPKPSSALSLLGSRGLGA